MAVTTTNLGVITAYGDAVAAGYTGTKAEWQTLMASYATVGQQAVDAKNDAVAAKDTAVSKATEATTAANTATTKANEASASAQSIAQSASQIAQNTSDISELKEELNDIFDYNGINNAFDGIYYSGYWNSSGALVDASNDICCSTKIQCPENANVVLKTTTVLTNYAIYISFFDSTGTNRIRRDTASSELYEGVSPEGTHWITFTYEKSGINKDTFGKTEIYINNKLDELSADIEDVRSEIAVLSAELTDIDNEVKSISRTYLNIFDKDAEQVTGYLSNGVVIGSTGETYDYMEVPVSGTYIYNNVPKLFYGNSHNSSIAFYDSTKTFIRNATITITTYNDDHSIGTFEIPTGVSYIRVTRAGALTADAMMIRGTSLPESYIPLGEHIVISSDFADAIHSNPLTGKIAVFDGDSICASLTDSSGNGAYAGRIEEADGIKTYNYGVGGGTITSGTYAGGSARHWIVSSIDTVYAQHPDADYIILEGGTNDADIIGSILNGNTPANFGSYSMTDFSGNYDDETFCGAVETLFYKAINYWTAKKIGFVIAPKMGKTISGYGATVNNRSAYFKTIKDICEKWGVPCLDLWNGCYMNPSLTACYDSSKTVDENIDERKLYMDGQHPTPTGYDYIAPIISAWMKTL